MQTILQPPKCVGVSVPYAGEQLRSPAVQSGLTLTTCPCCGSVMETKVPVVDLNTNVISWGGKTTKLRPVGAELMAMLVRRSLGIVTFDTLMNGIWGDNEPTDAYAALKVHLSHIRKALGPDSGIRIHNQPGVGYRLELDR